MWRKAPRSRLTTQFNSHQIALASATRTQIRSPVSASPLFARDSTSLLLCCLLKTKQLMGHLVTQPRQMEQQEATLLRLMELPVGIQQNRTQLGTQLNLMVLSYHTRDNSSSSNALASIIQICSSSPMYLLVIAQTTQQGTRQLTLTQTCKTAIARVMDLISQIAHA